MADRLERIEKLLHELRYEFANGILEGDISEEMGWRFYVPTSNKIRVVICEFKTQPVPRRHIKPNDLQLRLRVVK